ncbi:hypothetical protein HYS97_03285 [Candidatus Daviesbacteria bacterium]|nr:hypothetical protein [Candidatus Daviesbacteria bacterium]
MNVLPIKFISEEDVPLIGKNLFNLTKLHQAGIGKADGIIVLPPDIHLKNTLKHYQYKDREVFEASLHIIKKDIEKIPLSDELESFLIKRKVDPKKAWLKLLDTWLSEIRSRVWRGAIFMGITENLTAQPLFFTDTIRVSGDAFYDPVIKHSIINGNTQKLDPEIIHDLEVLVQIANRKLFIPQVYHWVFDGNIRIVKVVPFTQFPKNHIETVSKLVERKPNADVKKSTVKILLDLSEDFRTSKYSDGAIIHAEKILDYEMKLAKFAEIAADYNSRAVSGFADKDSPVIYKLADISDNSSRIRGTLRLIHLEPILKKEAEVFLFARNKKGLLNTQVAIPYVRNIHEFLQIKRNLASFGVSRKGSLKIWLELSVPENFVNLDEYLTAGFDGAIVNLDELSTMLGGFSPNSEESIYLKSGPESVLKFIEEGLRVLHKSKIPVVFTGQLSLNDEVMKFLILKGVWGLSVNPSDFPHLLDHLPFIEEHNLKHQILN